jgi:GDP-D-mannose dehydratase
VSFLYATVPDVQGSIKNPILTSDINLIDTLVVLEAARLKAKRVVFASSTAVYDMIETHTEVSLTSGRFAKEIGFNPLTSVRNDLSPTIQWHQNEQQSTT